MRTHLAALVLALAACVTPSSLAGDGGEAFTYQGQLRQNGAAAVGPLDVVFRIYDSATDGLQVGSSVVIANFVDFDEAGRFTVEIPFASATFTGAARWLEIEVEGVVLTPRQRINPVPYATRSLEVAAVNNAALAGTYSNALNLSSPSNTVSGTFTGSGANLSSLNASSISTGTLGGSRLSGSYGNPLTLTNASNQFAGNGAGLTSLNASNIASGTLGGSLLAGLYGNALTMTNPANQFGGNGAALTNLNASNVASGTLGGAFLNGTYGNALTMTNASNQFGGNGSALASLNASNLASGTLASGRLSGTYGNALTMTNATNQFGGNGSGLTNLNASNINSGTLGTAQLPSGGSWPLSGALNLDATTLVVDAPSNRVGIGTSAPQVALSVVGGINVDESNVNDGGLPSSLRFGSFSGEAIGSNRNGGENTFGLDLWTGGSKRLSITNDGYVGIGTTAPTARLHMPATGSGQAVSLPGIRIEEKVSSLNVICGHADNAALGDVEGVTISGGGFPGEFNNASSSSYTTIAGGTDNHITIDCRWSVIGGGHDNKIWLLGGGSTIAGGSGNTATMGDGSIGGGSGNSVGYFGTVAGGEGNHVEGDYGSVGGGQSNSAGYGASVAGGLQNHAGGTYSAIPGGEGNAALGNSSFAAGQFAKAFHNGSFVWADYQIGGSAFGSTGANQFLVRANGGVGINTNAPTSSLQVNGGIRARGGSPGGSGSNNNGFAFAGNGGDNDSGMFSSADGQLEFYSNANELIRITPGGNVGIGTNNPGSKLEVNGSAAKPGGGLWSVSSDARLKKNVAPLEHSLEDLLRLHGVTYEYIDPAAINELEGTRMGFIAQNVEEVFPDWVDIGPNGFRRLTIRGFEAVAVEAIRELREEKDAEIRTLRSEKNAEIETLRGELAATRGRLDEMEATLRAMKSATR